MVKGRTAIQTFSACLFSDKSNKVSSSFQHSESDIATFTLEVLVQLNSNSIAQVQTLFCVFVCLFCFVLWPQLINIYVKEHILCGLNIRYTCGVTVFNAQCRTLSQAVLPSFSLTDLKKGKENGTQLDHSIRSSCSVCRCETKISIRQQVLLHLLTFLLLLHFRCCFWFLGLVWSSIWGFKGLQT